jgi:signal transduction histidine kinase
LSGNDFAETRVVEVLLIEDNPVDARVFREIFDRTPGTFSVSLVSSLADAISALRSNTFGVAVIDLNLPDSKGLDTLKSIRQVSDVPTIVLTGISDEAVAIEALRLGAQDYLMKSELDARVVPRALRYAMERHRMQAQLEQSQRVARLGNLAGALAHNFNNVLMGIQPHAELVKRAAKDNPKITASIEQIEASLKRGKSITSEILRFTRPTPPRIAPVRVSELFESLQREFPAVSMEQASGDLTVAADREQLGRALANLIRNGLEAKPDSTVKVSARRGDSAIEFQIVDTGGGIPTEARDRIFDPLFTTKRQATGLGLSVVQQIVDAHRGSITVESASGVGTTFRVTIPSA